MERPRTHSEQELFRLYEERDHLNIQISLLNDAETPQAERLQVLNRQLESINRSIFRHKPSERN